MLKEILRCKKQQKKQTTNLELLFKNNWRVLTLWTTLSADANVPLNASVLHKKQHIEFLCDT